MTPSPSNFTVYFFVKFIFSLIVSCKSSMITENIQFPVNCSGSQFYETASLSCVDCPANSTSSADRLACLCRDKWILQFNEKSNELICESCELQDSFQCVAANASCDKHSIKVTQKVSGILEVHCLKCPHFYRPNADQSTCVQCPDYITGSASCSCPSPSYEDINGLCLQSADLSAIPNVPSLSMAKFLDNYVESAWLKLQTHTMAASCKGLRNTKSCQHLANLCVLIHYNYDAINACNLYRQLGSLPKSFSQNVPIIYFDESFNSRLLNEQKVPFYFKKPPKDSSQELFCAVYSLNGTFVGFQSFVDTLRQFYSIDTLQMGRNIALNGVNSKRKFQIPLAKLRLTEPFLFDLYLRYAENGVKKTIAIPVRVLNYSRGGVQRNREKDPLRWQLVKRFFFADSVISKTSSNSTARFLQYLSSFVLTLKIGPATDTFVPYVSLVYDTVDTQTNFRTERVEFELSVESVGDSADSLFAMEVSLSVLSSLSAVYALFRTVVWYRRSDRSTIDILTLFRLIINAASALANIFFIVVFLTTFYWLVTYRNQSDFFLALPSSVEEKFISDILISAFVLKAVSVITLIIDQCSIDIFFIDWEKTKPGSEKTTANTVSIWRSYFVANEWNELQTIRRISVPIQTCCTLLCLEVFGLKKYALIDTESTSIDGSYSSALRLALVLTSYLSIALVQLVFNSIVYERFFEHKIQRFIDLCSLANISVWMLSHNRFGYYLHGRSPHGFADTDMRTMIDQLKREEDNLCGQRGLLPGSDLQTFTISLDQKMYAAWKKLSLTISTATGIPANPNCDAYSNLNKFFTAFLDHALSELDYEVYDRYFLEKLTDCEIREPINKTVFLSDPDHTFHNLLLYGNELQLVIFHAVLIGLVEAFTQDYVTALLVDFLIYQVLVTVRYYFARRNLAKKTLIDSRFLF